MSASPPPVERDRGDHPRSLALARIPSMTNGHGVDLAERGHQVAVVSVRQVVDVTKEVGLLEQVRHEMDLVLKSTRMLGKSLGDVIGRHVPV
jgi:hypothetical protein